MPLATPSAFWMLPVLGSGLAVVPLGGSLPPPTNPPPLETGRGTRLQQPQRTSQAGLALEGTRIQLNGRRQTSRWLWQGNGNAAPQQLWLTLELLQEQLGVSSRSRADGSLDLEWFGQPLLVPASDQRSLGDEVAVDAWPLLGAAGVQVSQQGPLLQLSLPAPTLLGVRSAGQGTVRRVVLDLQGPALVASGEGELQLDLQTRPDQLTALQAMGLAIEPGPGRLTLRPSGGSWSRVFSLGEPPRLVIDLPRAGGREEAPAAAALDPRLQALLGRSLRWDRLERQGVRINAVRLDPRTAPLQLRPLARSDGMEGLSSLVQLAGRNQALVAVNGGYFNRVRRLPLGALKIDGRWLSGPILNRGVVAWGDRSLPSFGRLMLVESVSDANGQSQALVGVNSGYVQRGISRYNADWGPLYRALSGEESAVLLQEGRVTGRFGQAQLEAGVPLRPGQDLLVGRGGIQPPWGDGQPLQLQSRPSSALGEAPNVLGGGPLLLQGGQIVLNGGAEGFSANFLRQGAPRTVIGSDGQELWLITLEGSSDAGPSLVETAGLLQQLGLREALNLDGGSSTGLVMGGSLQVKGRGVAGSVHNALGLVP